MTKYQENKRNILQSHRYNKPEIKITLPEKHIKVILVLYVEYLVNIYVGS